VKNKYKYDNFRSFIVCGGKIYVFLNKEQEDAYVLATQNKLRRVFKCEMHVHTFSECIMSVSIFVKYYVCGRCAIGEYCKLIIFYFLQSIIPI